MGLFLTEGQFSSLFQANSEGLGCAFLAGWLSMILSSLFRFLSKKTGKLKLKKKKRKRKQGSAPIASCDLLPLSLTLHPLSLLHLENVLQFHHQAPYTILLFRKSFLNYYSINSGILLFSLCLSIFSQHSSVVFKSLIFVSFFPFLWLLATPLGLPDLLTPEPPDQTYISDYLKHT